MKNMLSVFGEAISMTQHRESPDRTMNIISKKCPSGVEVHNAVIYPKTATKAERAAMARDLTEKCGYSQRDAARALDMSPSYVSKLLK